MFEAVFSRKGQLLNTKNCFPLPVVRTSKTHWAVCHLQRRACTQSTVAHGCGGDTGWQSGTGCHSVGRWAGILLHWHPVVECCCKRNQGTGRSPRWALQGPVHQTRVADTAWLLWRVAASSFETLCTTQQLYWQTSAQSLLQKSVKAFLCLAV